MAEKRMFAKTIIDSDAFLEMPISARLLYYDLGMRADDDGFVNSPKKIMRMIGASEDDMRILAMRKFIIPFDNGLVVIKHWRINNYLRNDRYKETTYKDEKALLIIDENNAYTIANTDGASVGIPLGIPTVDADKNRLDKSRLDKSSTMSGNPTAQTINEAVKEVVQYLNEKTGCHYKPSSQATIKLIKARLNDDFTLQDFKTVISKKCAEWKNTEQEKFLRPETLFGTKFEGYLNQKIVKKSGNPFLDSIEEGENDESGNEGFIGISCDDLPKLLQGE
jgi:uncharacterized phage protein (TIGR02220 family)